MLSRALRSVAVIDAGEPRNAPASHMQGYLSRDGMPPAKLLAVDRAEVLGYGAHIRTGTVALVSARECGGFLVFLADGSQLAARRILVAAGLRDELPDVPGVCERFGRDVLHCPYCHGYEVRDQKVGVLGGYPRRRTARPPTAPVGWRRRLLPVTRIVIEDGQLRGVELAGGRVIARHAVFVRPRFLPNSNLLAALGCAVDDRGWVRADAMGRTSVPGVWVAGNDLNADLVDEDTARDLAQFRGGEG